VLSKLWGSPHSILITWTHISTIVSCLCSDARVIYRKCDSLRSLPPVNCESLELQGKNKRIAEMMFKVSTLRSKFELKMTDLTSNNLITFLICRAIWKSILILLFRQRSMWPKYVLLSKISEIYSVTSKKIRRMVEYFSFPFKSHLNIKETSVIICENYSFSKSSLENEILTLKNDIFLKTHAGQESFWKLVPRNKVPNVKRCSNTIF
jgi:hypothetical protein